MKLSEMSVDQLKRTPFFHLVDPRKLDGFEDHVVWLEAILHNPCYVSTKGGKEFLIGTKQLVARVSGLKVEIYPNEHPPPHFHVKSPNINASVDIENCKLIKGKISRRDLDKITFWHKKSKALLIESWNMTRPTICSVGRYEGT